MAKFALPMKNGVAVSKMAELREHFDLKEAIKYLGNGRLMKWLRDRGYDEEADKLEDLRGNVAQIDRLEFAQRLCSVLGMIFDKTKIDPKELEGLMEFGRKADKLAQYTNDTDILGNADRAAFNQADLDELAKDDKPEIYLCNGQFKIPLVKHQSGKGKRYYGIGNAIAEIPSNEYVGDLIKGFEEFDITFDNEHKIKFDDKYEQVLQDYKLSKQREEQEREEKRQREDYYQKGTEALEARNYREAMDSFIKAADLGHAQAMTGIGNLYYQGAVGTKDLGEAIEYFQSAAEKDEPEALWRLSTMFFAGEGVERSYRKAFSYTQKAVEASRGKSEYVEVLKSSLYEIGEMYFGGMGTEENIEMARKCFEEAADLGETTAMIPLGMICEEQDPPDLLKARGWYRKAADLDDANGMFHLGYWYETHEEDVELAVKWYRKAAAFDNPDALLRLGLLYKADMVAHSGESAQELIERAAELGNADAMVFVGRWYSSWQEAREWFQKAAEQGNTEAMCRLGLSYEGKDGSPQNYTKAAEWYKKAVEGGDIESMNRLGVLYSFGNGVEKDETIARKLFLDAAIAGNPDAMAKVGIWFEKGIGGEKDMMEAMKWYEKAANAGATDGMACLGDCYYNDGKYSEAEHWYEKAAKGGNGYAANRLSAMYENGNGVAKDEESAEFWRKKAKKLGQADNEKEQEEGLSTTTKVLAGAAAVGALAVAPMATAALGIGFALNHFFRSKDK